MRCEVISEVISRRMGRRMGRSKGRRMGRHMGRHISRRCALPRRCGTFAQQLLAKGERVLMIVELPGLLLTPPPRAPPALDRTTTREYPRANARSSAVARPPSARVA